MSLSDRSRPSLHIETAAALLAIGFGLVLRLRQYTLNLSFWLDEAMLALNITGRDFTGLVKPLDYDQGAPLGFLWVVKLFESLFGNNEYSLRLFTFLASCLSLFLLWRVARRIIQPVGVIFALLILASGRHLVYYGVQVKQYGVDVTVTLLLYLLALDLFTNTPPAKKYWLAAVLGGLSIWMSHPAVFTLAALGSVLILQAALDRDWRKALAFLWVSIFWLINFGILYQVQYRALGANSYLTGFWKDYFMPLSASAPAWVVDRLAGLFYNPGGIALIVPSFVILVVFLAGVVSLLWRKNQWVWMFLLSLGFTLAASGLGKYPFGGRMGMFAIPGLLICTGEGLDLPRRWLASRPRLGTVIAVLLAVVLAYDSLDFSVELALKPKKAENIAPTMAYLKSNYRPDDVIYLYRMSIPAFRYYAPRYGLETARVFDGGDFHLDRSGYQAELEQLVGNKRVWLLFSHLTDYEYVEDRDALLEFAGYLGEKKREFSDPGTLINLYLFDLAP